MSGLSQIVKTVSLVLFVPILTFGLYVVAHGHLTPGGGFQGGTVIATALALFLVAFGAKEFKRILGKDFLSAVESIGLLSFGALALLGLGTAFFANFLANSGGLFGKSVPVGANAGIFNSAGTIPLMNFAVGIEVASALSLVLLLMYLSEKGVGK